MGERSANWRETRQSLRAEHVDVTFRRHYAGLLRLAVVDSGTWTTNQSLSRLTLVTSGESSTCRVGDRFVRGDLRYEHLGASPTTGALVGAVERDDCGGGWAEETWIRLSP